MSSEICQRIHPVFVLKCILNLFKSNSLNMAVSVTSVTGCYKTPVKVGLKSVGVNITFESFHNLTHLFKKYHTEVETCEAIVTC